MLTSVNRPRNRCFSESEPKALGGLGQGCYLGRQSIDVGVELLADIRGFSRVAVNLLNLLGDFLGGG